MDIEDVSLGSIEGFSDLFVGDLDKDDPAVTLEATSVSRFAKWHIARYMNVHPTQDLLFLCKEKKSSRDDKKKEGALELHGDLHAYSEIDTQGRSQSGLTGNLRLEKEEGKVKEQLKVQGDMDNKGHGSVRVEAGVGF
jgi:hypothetical protein